ncbi:MULTISPECIES: FtsW/RodA/SpoVE family cell cycle protein [Enterococcaceae]|uniref:FtsW/RodA/SpoVE family cell cycle protein n=1 Tax=Enterococcaceae TaxID=81852 RepID=UPI000E4EDC96|nr:MULTISPECIES: FtsW/RodA/SpoVE family cell cycle protein [Enterococcaceae]MCI0129998.1 FtsW/RodA/SpoVE family cell cycle protein [Vagococcus sp. CY53-2]RGI30880.1 FtsW/RodA/SpoVE family cell cycle protein [Melissococcus sp. OM08-11BH]UNM88845.1 FtsW/RodA/SpoVE family cell cycle protein [Vagococcus sp. CY52-2]
MRKKLQFIDFKILIPYIVLNIIGIIMIFSASSYKLNQQGKSIFSIATKQGIFFVISLILIAVIYKTKLKVYQTDLFQKIMLGLTYILLVATSVLGLGKTISGAQRWISIGSFSFQPSEFVMISTILYCAFIFSKRQETINQDFFKSVMVPTAIVGGMILLVLIQPNVGGAAIIFFLFSVLILSSGIPAGYTFLSFGGLVVFIGLVWQIVMFNGGMLIPERFSHVYKRFSVMSNPFEDKLNNGFQLVNSYFAIYNGGWFGKGLGKSIQKKGFLPVAETDFIFSITMEELGLIASIIILMILFYLILRILSIGIRSTNAFNSLACIGISTAILLQSFVNLGGILSIMPMTGVPFPFMSYGGSNLMTLSILVGIALNISADEKRHQLYEGHALEIQPYKQINMTNEV